MMNVYVVFGFEDRHDPDCTEEMVKIFLTRESAENFIAQNEYWAYLRIEKWEAE